MADATETATGTLPDGLGAQARMLAEGVSEVWPPASELPDDLAPRTPFTDEQIRLALPERGGFGFRDLRLSRRPTP
jgi:NADH dehydrogenase